jgi:putative tryptophan/tyrosine transport system substrate-binding protein
MLDMKRREFIALLGAGGLLLAVKVRRARAQQPALPVVGYLSFGSPESDASRLSGLRRGLNQSGYVEGRNLVIEYRWAGNQPDRLPALAADLVQLPASAIVSPGLVATLAAKAATTSIPTVFVVSTDPVQLGLVASLNRPGGNLTGFNNVTSELGAKGLALLHELVPSTATIGFLENPNNPAAFELMRRDVLAAAHAIGLKVQIFKASNDREIDAAFVSLVQARTGALFVGNDLFSTTGLSSLLHSRHAMRFLPCTRNVSSWWRAGSSVTERA